MRKRKRAGERINESNTDNVIEVFFYSSSCYIISAVLTSCQGLWLLDNCVHFSHRADSKGLLFSNNTMFLSGEYSRSHAHYTRTQTHTHWQRYTNLLILHYASTHRSHSHMHMFTNNINSSENTKVPSRAYSIGLYVTTHTSIYNHQEHTKYHRLFWISIATTKLILTASLKVNCLNTELSLM